MSEGSNEGGLEARTGFSGVRNGDLKGLWSVLVAVSSRLRFACGVDIVVGV